MKILIAGASGAIGRPLVRCLRADHYEVFALTRSPDSAPWKEIGAEPVIADALDAAAVKAAVGRIRPDAVINELTSLPRRYTPAEIAAAAERDRKVRVEGNMNLLAALRDAGVRRYLLQSCGFWYAPGAGLADESSRSSPAVRRGSRPALAPTGNWKRAHRRRQESSSSRYVTDSSTAPAPGTRARAISVIRCGASRFRSSARARVSTASCISTTRPERPPPRWSARRERTTSSTETRRLSACGWRRSRVPQERRRRLASAKKRRFGRQGPTRSTTRRGLEALRTRKPDASLSSVRARSSGCGQRRRDRPAQLRLFQLFPPSSSLPGHRAPIHHRPNVCSSFRHASLKSRSGSTCPSIQFSRISFIVIFGAR